MYCPKCGGVVAAGTPFCPTCGAGMAPAVEPAPTAPAYYAAQMPVPAYPAWDYATWPTRAIGFIVDGLLVGAGMAVLYFVVGGIFGSMLGLIGGHGFAGGMCCMMILLFPLATLAVGFYNSVYLIAQRGYSIGQGIVKVKVVDANGQLLTQSTAFIRLLVRVALSFVPFLPLLDMLWPLWDDRRQTLHDKAVNCYVVNNPSGV
jgi:uncharacterized RDD family membrane protein YckC